MNALWDWLELDVNTRFWLQICFPPRLQSKPPGLRCWIMPQLSLVTVTYTTMMSLLLKSKLSFAKEYLTDIFDKLANFAALLATQTRSIFVSRLNLPTDSCSGQAAMRWAQHRIFCFSAWRMDSYISASIWATAKEVWCSTTPGLMMANGTGSGLLGMRSNWLWLNNALAAMDMAVSLDFFWHKFCGN